MSKLDAVPIEDDLRAALRRCQDGESWYRSRMLDLEQENTALHQGDREHLVRKREAAEATSQTLREDLAERDAEIARLTERLAGFERWANPPLVEGAVWPVGDQ